MTDEPDPFVGGGPGDDNGLVNVDLEFATLRDFREKMAPYVGDRGFFARSDQPLPRDTPVNFRFVLPEGFTLAEGTATVAWTIDPEKHPELVPGMALRFVDVGRASREAICELVDFHIAAGGDPFELGPAASEPGEIPTDSLDAGERDLDLRLDFPLPSEPPAAEALPQSGSREEVLPPWLSETREREPIDPEMNGDRQRQAYDDPEATSPVGGGAGPSVDFEVDLIIDDVESQRAVETVPEISDRESIEMPQEALGPPRDLRLGLVVAAGLAVVAVIVLVWSFGFRSRQLETPVALEAPGAEVEPGVELVHDGDAAPTGSFVAEKTPTGPLPVEAVAPEGEPPVEQLPVLDRRAGRVVDVGTVSGPGLTTVMIRGDGFIEEGSVSVARLKDPERIWVRVRHIETFYKPNEILVGSPEVRQVRIGHHPEESPPSLYVVIDLADNSVMVTDRAIAEDTIRLSVGRR
jgi:hypothetical protein